MKNPTKEQFYAVKPDFLTGWDSTVQDKNLGPIKELEKNGVQVYIMKSLHSSDINLVFEDILNYGKIFNLEDNAKKVVNKMKADLAAVQKKLPKNKVKVFTYDSGDKTPFVVGGDSIGNTIITLAGGDNIFKNIKKAWADGNWEKVLVENPDIILIIDYGDQSAESKIKFLKEKSPIKDLKAVKNNKFVVIELADITAGIRNVDAIKKLAKAFHNITIK
jgi:hemin-binding periplasmic protein hmuT